MKEPYRFLEHTADAYIEAYGSNLEEAFGNAALGMTDVMTKVEKVETKTCKSFILEAQDEQALLYNWLEELLLEFELKNMLYSRFEVSDINKTVDGFRLFAKAWGENYNANKHPSKVGIKAATYHQMEIIKEVESVILRFILDI
ncbi:archease [Candidatus Bathyarchaeota archaeon]|nr:archease [Candidatus Bathyarchaeota archaeon]